MSWCQLPPLPPSPSQTVQPGLAGALIGVSNDALIVAGGANFPGKPVWEKGSKSYYDDIYVLLPGMEWKTGFKLPRKLGYGTALMIDDRIVCIGGTDGRSNRREVFSMEWDRETESIIFDSLPSLPVPMAKTAGAVVDNTLYVVGGVAEVSENGRKVNRPSNSLYHLDMDHLENGWQKDPSFPGPVREKTHAASQRTPEGECLFIFSGMSFPPGESEPDVMTDGLRYNPRTRQWTKIAPIAPKGLAPRAVCSGTAIACGERNILVFGGRGSQNLASILKTARKLGDAKKTGDSTVVEACEKIMFDYFTKTEFRYNDLVLSYDTWTDTWRSLGVYPGRPVTGSRAVWWNGGIAIPSGEIRPGVRTSSVMHGTFLEN